MGSYAHKHTDLLYMWFGLYRHPHVERVRGLGDRAARVCELQPVGVLKLVLVWFEAGQGQSSQHQCGALLQNREQLI